MLSRDEREGLWRLDFLALVLALKIVVPAALAWTLATRRAGKGWVGMGIGGMAVLGWVGLVVLHVLGGWVVDGKEVREVLRERFDLEGEIQGMGTVGLVSVAVLSGWGAIHAPYVYGPWFVKRYSDAEIQGLEEKLVNVMEMIAAKERREAQYKYQVRKMGVYEKEVSVSGEPDFSLLATELFLELNEMKMAKQASIIRKTLMGRVYTWLGYAFAGYSFLKVVAACVGVIHPKKADDPDFVTRSIWVALMILQTNEKDAVALSQTISFVLVGVLVFNSFRGLLVMLGRVFHELGPRAEDTNLTSLLLTEIMGQYLLSSVILLDLNVPVKYRGKMFYEKFEYFRVWFDACFLAAALASAVLVYAVDRAKNSRTEFYDLHEKLI